MKVAALIERLRNDRFDLGDASDEADLARRRTWNAAINHAIGVVSQGDVEAGLRELRDTEPFVRSGVVAFDLTDIGVPDVGGEG